jgi:hypothetical protein
MTFLLQPWFVLIILHATLSYISNWLFIQFIILILLSLSVIYQRLSKDLQKFLSPAKNPTIKFSGPSDNIVKVNLIPDPTKARRFIFGEGWTTFCQVNQIENGKLLYLKADQNDEYSNIIIVQFA